MSTLDKGVEEAPKEEVSQKEATVEKTEESIEENVQEIKTLTQVQEEVKKYVYESISTDFVSAKEVTNLVREEMNKFNSEKVKTSVKPAPSPSKPKVLSAHDALNALLGIPE